MGLLLSQPSSQPAAAPKQKKKQKKNKQAWRSKEAPSSGYGPQNDVAETRGGRLTRSKCTFTLGMDSKVGNITQLSE